MAGPSKEVEGLPEAAGGGNRMRVLDPGSNDAVKPANVTKNNAIGQPRACGAIV